MTIVTDESRNVIRLKGWEKRYIQEIQHVIRSPFNWATNNCGHVIVAAVRACHGDHPVADYLRPCVDEASTLDLLRREGGVRAILEQYFYRLPTPALAQQADIGIVTGQFYDSHSGDFVDAEVGCAFLDGQAVGLREKGPFRIPYNKVTMAFKV